MAQNRYSEFQFKNGVKARNRIVVPAMASQTSDEHGYVTEKTLHHYSRLAEAKPGILFVEYSYVHQSGRSEGFQMGVESDLKLEGMAKLASLIKTSGAIAAQQLTHAGGKTSPELSGGTLWGPSAIAVPVKDKEMTVPTAVSTEEVVDWVQWFVNAAHRAVLAGFEMVELHSAHGYGLNQWLSPITNQRSDQFGGCLANRVSLLSTIISSIKVNNPSLLISVRIPGQDHMPGGLTLDDNRILLKVLESIGVDLVNVSSGIGGWRRPEGRKGEGYLVDDAAKIKAMTSLPVIGVGGIETGEYIDSIITNKFVDFAAVGRAILKDPVGWRQSVLPK